MGRGTGGWEQEEGLQWFTQYLQQLIRVRAQDDYNALVDSAPPPPPSGILVHRVASCQTQCHPRQNVVAH